MHRLAHSILTRWLTASACLLTATAAAAQQFQTGDVFLASSGLVAPPNNFYNGIARVNVSTGAVTPLATLTGINLGPGRCTYDPFRDRILVGTYALPGQSLHTFAIDATGTLTPIDDNKFTRLAPRGDGIVYGYVQGSAPNYVPRIDYLDAANATHTLLDVGYAQPWSISGPSTAVFADPIRAMIYEPTENALFLAMFGDGTTPGCSGAANFDLSIRKLPLTSNGDALRSAPSCTTFNVSAAVNASELPLQFSYGPQGQLVLSVRPNASGALPRILQIDPATNQVSPFVTIDYPLDIFIACGVYVPQTGNVLHWDGSKFRNFAPFSSGAGSVLASYGLGSVESQMFVVGPVGPGPSLTADVAAVSTSQGGVQNLTYAPGPSQAGNVYLLAGTLSGWSPGLPLPGGLVMPINYDAFTDLTVQLANSPVLINTMGTFGPSGSINAAVVVPPGILNVLSGFTLHFAGVAATPGLTYTHTSNPVPLLLMQ